jgi:iron complex transport system substrate-binding protein
MYADSLTGYPRRIICLTEETTETLYLLGQQERIVGVSGYTVRPKEARQKPKVSAFINAKFDKIIALEPDLVLAFSDLQADIAAELIRRGVNVFTFNQRSVAAILQMILTIGRITGCEDRAIELVTRLHNELDAIKACGTHFSHRPRVYFEEWSDPLISGIRWVEELIEIAGGECVFPHLRKFQSAKNRIIQPEDVVAANPDIIIASWSSGEEGSDTAARGLASDRSGSARPHLRNQIPLHPATRPGGADRRRSAATRDSRPRDEPAN